MIEVFRTDVEDLTKAAKLRAQLNEQFPEYQLNFDLEDCDRILRIDNRNGMVETGRVVEIVAALGCTAERLD